MLSTSASALLTFTEQRTPRTVQTSSAFGVKLFKLMETLEPWEQASEKTFHQEQSADTSEWCSTQIGLSEQPEKRQAFGSRQIELRPFGTCFWLTLKHYSVIAFTRLLKNFSFFTAFLCSFLDRVTNDSFLFFVPMRLTIIFIMFANLMKVLSLLAYDQG